jgi:hypothetical protein
MAVQGVEEVGNRVYLLNPLENVGCLHLEAEEQFGGLEDLLSFQSL